MTTARKNLSEFRKEQGAVMAEEEARNVSLHGEFHFKADAKGRVSLPSQFRKVLSDNLVVTTSPKDDCLYIFEKPDFDAWVADAFNKGFGGYTDTDPVQAGLHRELYSRARDVQTDTAGRILLAPELRTSVGIQKEVVVVGNGGRFEVWDEERYAASKQTNDLTVLFG